MHSDCSNCTGSQHAPGTRSPNLVYGIESEENHEIRIYVYKLLNPVVVYNPTTSEQEIRPLNEVASSHLARRCFVGNLYKQVKDPNLVGALSGHKEGSKAFNRYRMIDEETNRQTMSYFE